jgi:Undecaprenyl-phosphate glucose phosphotransferase
MYRRHGNKLGLVFLANDVSVTAAIWIGAYCLRFALWQAPQGVPDAWLVIRGLPLVLLLAAVSYRAAGFYEIHRLQRLPREIGVIARGSGLVALLVTASVFYRRDLYESRLALAAFAAMLPAGLGLSRRLLWGVLEQLRRRGLNHSKAVIVGSGRVARRLLQTIRDNRWTGLEAVGLVDDANGSIQGCPRLGALDELGQVVRAHDVDHVFVAIPLVRYGDLCRIYRTLDRLLVEVHLVPDIPPLAGMRPRMLEIDRTCFVSLRENPHRGWHRVVKRGLDVVGASIALLAFAPLMLAIAVLTKLTSPGPVFYRQPRTGLGGHSFSMLKFRTMAVDAEAATGPVWTARKDPRCTPLGRFLRRYSLDELPQLWNVLRGDMSLVGPRPERRPFVERFCQSIPGYWQRHQVKAGMTGWAQVHGWRGNTSVRRRLEHDLYYIANWSIWLDVKILWLTLRHGFRNRNAY